MIRGALENDEQLLACFSLYPQPVGRTLSGGLEMTVSQTLPSRLGYAKAHRKRQVSRLSQGVPASPSAVGS